MHIIINGKICKANEGENILNVARREGIFIPAMCYLSGCSPTLACRLCMVEADGRRVYSCNAKAKEGLKVITNTPEINVERNAIMQAYCVNHPLECGVCDKSGECELQNFAHKMQVSEQNFAIKDSHKPHRKWGLINYDPALCIVCERCVTVCKDKIGESALKTVPREAEQVPKELKDSMPKDAFAVWSKLQKSLIAPSNGERLECSFCGECISVCPVGALVSADFQYSSNAWELRRIPAANPHSSDCELIYYEVKPRGIERREEKIYRVTNEFCYGEINGAARFGFDFHNESARKNAAKFNEIAAKFKDATIKNIKFNSFITNEEAFILERLREKFGLNLINDEARAYQSFLREFSRFSGQSLYNGALQNLKQAGFIIVAGSMLRYDAPNVSYRVNSALKINKAAGFYFHPIAEAGVAGYSKNFEAIAHKAGLEEQILLLILAVFGRNLPKELEEFLGGFRCGQNLDEPSFVFSRNLGLDEQKFRSSAQDRESKILIIGEDFFTSPRAMQLAKFAGLIQKYTDFKLILIPPRTNSLGVAKICTLLEAKEGATLGYNEEAEYKFCVHGGDIDAGALNQQEGTFTNIDARVVPTNAALDHSGYFLNDLANALDISARYTIDYTEHLPKEAGFRGVKFDELQNFYDNAGEQHRGYILQNFDVLERGELKFEPPQEPFSFNLYLANPISQFSVFTAKSSLLNEVGELYLSPKMAENLGVNNGDSVVVKKGDMKFGITAKIDKNLLGEVAYLGYFDEKIPFKSLFGGSRFANVEILPVKNFKGENFIANAPKKEQKPSNLKGASDE